MEQLWIVQYAWLLELALFFVAIVLVNIFLKRILAQQKHRGLNENHWLNYIDYAALPPLRTLLWILFTSFLFDLAIKEFGLHQTIITVAPLRNAGIVACLVWFILRWKKIFQHTVTSRVSSGKIILDPGSIEIIGKLFTAVTLFIGILIILQIFGLNIVPLVTFGGIGAAALGIASKDVIANFYGGLMIYITKPFTIGDLIELPQKKVMGNIEEIGWYFTKIRDTHKKPIYIPNALFSTDYLLNQSRMTHRRIEEVITLRMQDVDKVEKLTVKIKNYLSELPAIDTTLPIYVYLLTFGPFSIDLEVKAFTLCTRYDEFMSIKQEVLLKIYALLEEESAELAYPVTEVLLRKDI